MAGLAYLGLFTGTAKLAERLSRGMLNEAGRTWARRFVSLLVVYNTVNYLRQLQKAVAVSSAFSNTGVGAGTGHPGTKDYREAIADNHAVKPEEFE